MSKNDKTQKLADRLMKIVEKEARKAGDYDIILILLGESDDGQTAMVEKIATRHSPEMIYDYLLQFHRSNPDALRAAMARVTGTLQ